MTLLHAPSFRVGDSPHGRGVFAQRAIAAGETILRFEGPRVDTLGALAKGERQGDALQIGRDLYIDIGDPGRLVNHACAPNAGIRYGLRLVAMEDIPAEREITYDYSTTMGDGLWTMRCDCGAPSCRGVVRDFAELSPTLQDHYLALGVVLEYLRPR